MRTRATLDMAFRVIGGIGFIITYAVFIATDFPPLFDRIGAIQATVISAGAVFGMLWILSVTLFPIGNYDLNAYLNAYLNAKPCRGCGKPTVITGASRDGSRVSHHVYQADAVKCNYIELGMGGASTQP